MFSITKILAFYLVVSIVAVNSGEIEIDEPSFCDHGNLNSEQK